MSIYVDLNLIDIYHRTFEPKLKKYRNKYVNFLIAHPELHHDYKKMCKVVNNAVMITKNKQLMTGGSPELILAAGVGASLSISSLIALFLYMMFKRKKCKPSYPMYTKYQIPGKGELISHFLPASWLEDAKKAEMTTSEFVDMAVDKLQKLVDIFSIFDETSGTKTEQVVKSVVKIGASIAATVATEGTVGSNLANAPFMTGRGIVLVAKFVDKILAIVNELMPVLETGLDILTKVQAGLDVADELISEAESPETAKDFKSAHQQLRFLYDVLMIDIRDGPEQCKCWVDFVFNQHFNKNADIDSYSQLICLLNDIYTSLNDSILGFIGSVFDTVIPDTLGLIGTLLPYFKGQSYIIYRKARAQLMKTYNKIPSNYRAKIQHPEDFSRFIYEILKKFTLGTVNDESLKMGAETIAFGIHKCLSIMFVFLDIFILFAELKAGKSSLAPDDVLNEKTLHELCEQ